MGLFSWLFGKKQVDKSKLNTIYRNPDTMLKGRAYYHQLQEGGYHSGKQGDLDFSDAENMDYSEEYQAHKDIQKLDLVRDTLAEQNPMNEDESRALADLRLMMINKGLNGNFSLQKTGKIVKRTGRSGRVFETQQELDAYSMKQREKEAKKLMKQMTSSKGKYHDLWQQASDTTETRNAAFEESLKEYIGKYDEREKEKDKKKDNVPNSLKLKPFYSTYYRKFMRGEYEK